MDDIIPLDPSTPVGDMPTLSLSRSKRPSTTQSMRASLTTATATALAMAVVLTVALGCAAPIPVVTNVVHDSDVRDCSPKRLEGLAGLDVAIVIDRSLSTRRPSGLDVDGDGRVHDFKRNSTFDRGDSRLAAMLEGVRALLQNAEGRDIRFSLMTFSGPTADRPAEETPLVGSGTESKLYADLSRNTPRLERVLSDMLSHGSQGTSVFYAGMRRGTHVLTARPNSGRRRVVLFLADGPRTTGIPPTGINAGGELIFRDPRMKTAAIMARKRKVVFHTFGFSQDAGNWRQKPLGQIAGATGGNYHAVEDPSQLYCHLAQALRSPGSVSSRELMVAQSDVAVD